MIDYIWSKNYDNCVGKYIIFNNSLSNNFLIFAVFDCFEKFDNNDKKESTLSFRDFSEKNIKVFILQINLVDLNLITASNDVIISVK